MRELLKIKRFFIENPAGWYVSSWPDSDGNFPKKCYDFGYDEHCLCICKGYTKSECDEKSICINAPEPVETISQERKQEGHYKILYKDESVEIKGGINIFSVLYNNSVRTDELILVKQADNVQIEENTCANEILSYNPVCFTSKYTFENENVYDLTTYTSECSGEIFFKFDGKWKWGFDKTNIQYDLVKGNFNVKELSKDYSLVASNGIVYLLNLNDQQSVYVNTYDRFLWLMNFPDDYNIGVVHLMDFVDNSPIIPQSQPNIVNNQAKHRYCLGRYCEDSGVYQKSFLECQEWGDFRDGFNINEVNFELRQFRAF